MSTEVKPFWQSKTLWVNTIAVIALIIQGRTGYVMAPDLQGYILAAVNGILRVVSKDSISLS